MTKNLTITIAGRSASGKSKVAFEISRLMKLLGFEVSNEDVDAARTKGFSAEQWMNWVQTHRPSVTIRTERISFAETASLRREEE